VTRVIHLRSTDTARRTQTWNAVRMEQQLPHNTTAPLIPILSGNDTATPVISPATAIDLPKCVLPVWPPPHTFDPTALPDGPFLLLSLYWASYTMARLLGLPLITRAGPRVLTLLVIVGVSIAVAVYQLYTTVSTLPYMVIIHH
jgi:hypothetical protein